MLKHNSLQIKFLSRQNRSRATTSF